MDKVILVNCSEEENLSILSELNGELEIYYVDTSDEIAVKRLASSFRDVETECKILVAKMDSETEMTKSILKALDIEKKDANVVFVPPRSCMSPQSLSNFVSLNVKTLQENTSVQKEQGKSQQEVQKTLC